VPQQAPGFLTLACKGATRYDKNATGRIRSNLHLGPAGGWVCRGRAKSGSGVYRIPSGEATQLDMQPDLKSHRLSLPGALFWLFAVAIVGVVGTLLLADAQIGRVLPIGQAIWWVWLVEVLLYLSVLLAPPGSIRISGVACGLVVGLVVRAGLGLICAIVRPPEIMTSGSFPLLAAMGYYYARHLVGAVLQAVVVTIYLWLVRSLLVPEEETQRGYLETAADETMSHSERQRLLLAALREDDDEEEFVAGSSLRSPLRTPPGAARDEADAAAQAATQETTSSWLETLRKEDEQAPPASLGEEDVSAEAPADEGGDESSGVESDTDRLELVKEAAPVQLSTDTASDVPLGVEAMPPELEEAARQAVAREAYFEGAHASGGITPGNRSMVWVTPGPVPAKPMGLAADALVGSAEQVSHEAGIGNVEVLLASCEDGCLGVATANGSYIIIARPQIEQLGIVARMLRATAARLAAVHLPKPTPVVTEPSIARCEVDEDLSGMYRQQLGRVSAEWGAVVHGLRCAGEPLILITSTRNDAARLAGAGIALCQAVRETAQVLGWSGARRILLGGSNGSVAIGRATLPQGESRVILAADLLQVALVGVRLEQVIQALTET